MEIQINLNKFWQRHIPVGCGDDFHAQAPQFLPELAVLYYIVLQKKGDGGQLEMNILKKYRHT